MEGRVYSGSVAHSCLKGRCILGGRVVYSCRKGGIFWERWVDSGRVAYRP